MWIKSNKILQKYKNISGPRTNSKNYAKFTRTIRERLYLYWNFYNTNINDNNDELIYLCNDFFIHMDGSGNTLSLQKNGSKKIKKSKNPKNLKKY